ncbi:type II toxin-antitoxin system RelE/ParE family toxin [Companilactobacillus ginsenosidimutans]|uniref:Plasmid maintenance system killer protein n=1 Tax=Companilactobacillus ginsenosidimutans TaxID=1007676 RepID=A0A0H4QK84_9LACO|nr:type II toxin-antitoxin system RelE/ParE family toxin [Companilactobacillus ginsenosidimutans]AKP67456.1 hypothetical protein ABM34_07875 [Companilactobacillus ginsenosidimutans]
MEIFAETKRMNKIIQSHRSMLKAFGKITANKLELRITEFRAASTLSEISHLPPQRLHKLAGDYNNYFAVNLTGNVRLVFRGLDANQEPTVTKKEVVAILIKEVIDYHGN